MRIIHLIRHAKPAKTGVFLGGTDVGIDGSPIEPSAINADYILVSPLRRARETAAALFPGRTAQIVNSLAERRMGEWEGKTWDEVARSWPQMAAQASADWFSVTPPGGEPWSEFYIRVEAAFDGLPQLGTIVIVSHVGVNALLRYMAGKGEYASFQQAYCEIVTVED